MPLIQTTNNQLLI